MERVIHRMADVPAALRQIRSALAPGSPFVLEYANKRNLKAILRYWLKRQSWDLRRAPVEFVGAELRFPPRYIDGCLRTAGFERGNGWPCPTSGSACSSEPFRSRSW